MPRAERTVYERLAPHPSLVAEALAGAADECFWIADAPGPSYPTLSADHETDLCVVGGGYAGLWTAVRAKQRDPGRRVVLLEAARLGWAASGRNGGFCAASITHGEENGRSRWPEEYDTLDRLGRDNLAGIVDTVRAFDMDVSLEQVGELSVAVEAHEVGWLREAAAAVTVASSTPTRCAPRSTHRSRSPACSPTTSRWCTPRGSPASWAGSPPTWGSRSSRARGSPGCARRGPGWRCSARRALGARLAGRPGHQRLPGAGAAVPAVHDPGLRLRHRHRAADTVTARVAGVGRAARAGRRGQPLPLLPAHPRRPDHVRRLRRGLPLRQAGAGGLRGAARRRTSCWSPTC